MRLITFASGSTGNCALVSAGGTHVLIDAGISMRRIAEALRRRGLSFSDINGILITHEHADHVAGLRMLAKHHALPVYAPPTLSRRLGCSIPELYDLIHPMEKERSFPLGELTALAFPTSHDTDESVGYRLEWAGLALGFCTDTGCVTPAMERWLPGCGAVLLEANHDELMLRYGSYPVALKRRVLSDKGHLSNAVCASLACELACAGVQKVALGHLSRENNRPSIAFEAVRQALDAASFPGVEVLVAPAEGDMEMEVPPCCVCG